MEKWQVFLGVALAVGFILNGLRILMRKNKTNTKQDKEAEDRVVSVFLNGIEIGSLPNVQYKAMLEKTRSDYWLYFGQGLNVLLVMMNLIARTFYFAIMGWLIFLFLGIMAIPAEMGDLVQNILVRLPQATPTSLGSTLQQFAFASLVWGIMATMIEYATTASAGRYGYRDVFTEAVNFQLRRELEAPAEGVVSVLLLDKETRPILMTKDTLA